jgi:hypothetical protein
MSAKIFKFSVPHHDRDCDYCQPHECLQIFGFAHQRNKMPGMYLNLALIRRPEHSLNDAKIILTGPLFSVIFRHRPEGFMLCLN